MTTIRVAADMRPPVLVETFLEVLVEFGVPGLVVAAGALSLSQQNFCVSSIDAAPWRSDLRRRTQHYGFVYDYRARSISPEAYLGPLPDWLVRLGRFAGAAVGVADEPWAQAIVNEYEPGVGIGEHSDARAFGPRVLTVSLGSATQMQFRPSYGAARYISVPVAAGDVVLMSGPARSQWTHAIEPSAITARRLSVTFRTV